MAPWLIAVLTSGLWCLVSIWLGPKVGWVDRPDRDDLTVHDEPVVPLGGVGVFLGAVLAAGSVGRLDLALVVSGSIVLVLGLADDRIGLSPTIRLVVEVIAATFLVAASSSYGEVGFWFSVAAVVLIVVTINAVNLFDGLDGLAGLTALVTALGLAFLLAGRGLSVTVPIALAAAIGGFLLFNWHPARVFLGDSGSYVIGLFLAHVILSSGPGVGRILVSVGALGLFVIDLFATILRRLSARGQLFVGDRSHLYDQLRRRGASVAGVALVSGAVQAVLMAVLVVADRNLSAGVAAIVVGSVFAVSLIPLARFGFLGLQRR